MILASLFFLLAAISGESYAGTVPQKVWIDTDPSVGQKDRDVDDGLALIQSFHSPELQILGVSIVFGNTTLNHAYPIGRKLVREFGPKNLHVYSGAANGTDLGKENNATQALEKALRSEKLTILALGPATNIATVLKNHPELKSNITEIVAVAGRRPGQRFTTGSKNKKAHRDFNFEQDPMAFQVILDSQVPLVLTPFEISSQQWIQEVDLKKMSAGGSASKWIVPAARNWLALWKSVFAVDGFNPFDTLAVAYLTNPDFLECETLPVSIQTLPDDATEERMQGTKAPNKPYLLASRKLQSAYKAKYCFNASADFKKDLIVRLIRN